MDIKVMKLLYFILCISIDKLCAFNHSMAEAECSWKNGLASYRHFVGDKGTGVDKSYGIKEDESAWISGYVKFSKFVAYHGCYRGDRYTNNKYEIQDNNIYSCLQNCSRINNLEFIGLLNKLCYCIKRSELNLFDSKPDNGCSQELIDANLESGTLINASIKVNISIYKIILDEKGLSWVRNFSEARGQCVKVWFNGGKIMYETDSCYSKAERFICTNSAYRSVSENCTTFYEKNLCIVSKSTTWLASFDECVKYTGKLTSFVYSKITKFLTPNISYWTGIFRTYNIENNSGVLNSKVCLSVKRIDGKIVLDPADCSADKAYVCEEDFSKHIKSTSTFSKQGVVTKANSATVTRFVATTIVENKTLTFATKFLSSKPTIETATEDNALNLNVVYIAVGAVFTVAFIIIITCIILRKRKQLKTSSSQKQSNSKDLDNNIADNTISGSLLDVAQRPELAQRVEDEVTYAIPDTAKKNSPLADSEYDSIRVNVPGKLKENTAKAKTIEDHVYGFNSAHPIDSDIEVYDHLEAGRKTNVSKPTDGIYNTLAEDSDTYNVLRSGNREESTKSAVNRTQIKQTCPTYDKLK